MANSDWTGRKPSGGSLRKHGGHRNAYRRPLRYERLEPRELLSITPAEQLMVYLINRARHDPVAYQHEQNLPVDLSTVTPRAALAVNDQLFASAGFHAEEMAAYNYFGHQSQVTQEWPNKMARDQGYPLPQTLQIGNLIYSLPDNSNQIESIAAGYATPLDSLNALIVDQGIDPPGHRIHLLGMDDFNAAAREIGVGYAYNSSSTYKDYWSIHATTSSTTNEFVTGVVFNDLNNNHRYDLNEGLGGVAVHIGNLSTVTNAGGGWSIPITDGTYTVTASGGALAGTSSTTVTVAGSNVEVDFASGVGAYIDFRDPTFAVTAPISGTYQAGQKVAIQWNAGSIGPNSTISLCYDQDTTWWNGNEHWIEINQASAANGSGSYTWDTTGVPAGTYYIGGYLWSDGRPVYSHLAQAITIQGAAPATFGLTAPTSGTFSAGQTIAIQWNAANVSAGGTVSLCYDADTAWWNGNEHWIEVDQAAAANGAGSYSWNTTGVAPGTYYVAGYVFSGGKPVYSHLTQAITIQGSAPPTFTVTGPASGTIGVGQTVPIQWTAGNVPAGSKISLCYDEDATWWNGNEHWVEVDQVAAANGSASFDWNTANVRPGKYYLAGYLWTGATGVFSHLGQAVTVQASTSPVFGLLGPTAGTFTAGQAVTIQWTAANVPAGSKVSLCFDEDKTWWNGNEHWIEIDLAAATNGAGSYSWTPTTPGTYYIGGYMWTGSAAIYSHLTQSITVSSPRSSAFALAAPEAASIDPPPTASSATPL